MAKIYLAGIVDGTTADQWLPIKKKLENSGHRVKLPLFLKPGRALDLSERRYEPKIRVQTLVDCDIIVTLEDWHTHEMGKTEINIARQLNLEVIHFTKISELCTP